MTNIEEKYIKLKNGMISCFEYDANFVDWCFQHSKTIQFYISFRLKLNDIRLVLRFLKEVIETNLVNEPDSFNMTIHLTDDKDLHICTSEIPSTFIFTFSWNTDYYVDFHITQDECVLIEEDLKRYINVIEEYEWVYSKNPIRIQ